MHSKCTMFGLGPILKVENTINSKVVSDDTMFQQAPESSKKYIILHCDKSFPECSAVKVWWQLKASWNK